ncbi:MAG: Na+/H+ antiporter subunit E [Oscillospiraceae bacterium]|nr:Na+/H+ antiporter subunit E [Oscillospiraceae bacterium]
MFRRISFVLILAFVWIILGEALSWTTIIPGLIFGVICIIICEKLLPFEPVRNLCIWRLILYLVYLLGQVYISAFHVMKIIFIGAKVDIVTAKTQVQSDFLKVVLGNSVTLTPGSILLDLRDNTLTALLLHSCRDHAGAIQSTNIVQQLERKLLRVEK